MKLIKPSWPAPENIFAYSTTRNTGNSQSPYASFNLAEHVGDIPEHVAHNRHLLMQAAELPAKPIWLQQVHGTDVININDYFSEVPPVADGAIATKPHRVCVVMTADCLPILLCNKMGTKVAAVHAGWRGLANGIIERTIAQLTEDPSELLAWLGPAIGPDCFEVSAEVLQPFINHDPQAAQAFRRKPDTLEKWLGSLYILSKQRLYAKGITEVYGGEYCTFLDENNFYSYRRDQGVTGRMATLIWLKELKR
jgi:YfiH family protein